MSDSSLPSSIASKRFGRMRNNRVCVCLSVIVLFELFFGPSDSWNPAKPMLGFVLPEKCHMNGRFLSK